LAIEIFGFAVSDIAAIGALIASPLIFWFGYSRTRRSEQIKISRELMDRIDVKLQKFKEIALPLGPLKHDVKEREVFIIAIDGLLREIEYFSYLLKIDEIRDENILRYCIPIIESAFRKISNGLRILSNFEKADTRVDTVVDRLLLDDKLKRLNIIKDSMKVWLDKYKHWSG